MKHTIFAAAIIALTALSVATLGQRAKDAETLFHRGVHFEEVRGEINEAIAIYEDIVKRYPEERSVLAQAYYHLGLCYQKLGQAQAPQAFRKVVEAYPDQAETVLLAKEQLALLVRAENAAQAEADTQAEQHIDKGNEFFNRWDYESAVREYEKAIKIRPNTPVALNAQYCIGQAWYRAGRYDIALRTLTNLLTEHPRSIIAPVTELMMSQVQSAMKNVPQTAPSTAKAGEDTLVDPGTGITFTKVTSLTGESDVITYTTDLNLSPNGKYLLSGGMVVPMDGSSPFELIGSSKTGIQATRATWSPDGTKAAFYSGDALCVVPVSSETGRATGPYRKIHELPLRWQANPAWSPDGRKLAYQSSAAGLWMIDSDGTNLKEITPSQGLRVRTPAWSRDGKTIAYGILPTNAIWLYDIESGGFSELTETGYRVAPAWSPDGNWMMGVGSGGASGRLHFYNLTQRNAFDYSPPKGVGSLFSWRKDGRLLFFRTSYFGNTGLRIASSEGGPSFEPVHLLTNWGTPRWSDDGKSIGVQGEDKDSEIAMSMVPLSGGRSYLVDLGNLVEGKPFPFAFSSGLRRVLFTVRRADGKEDLFAVPISPEGAKTTGPVVKIFDGWRREGAFNIVFSMSPDGERAALLHEGDIWIAYTNGNDPTQIPQKASYLRWTDNGKALLLDTASGWSLLENPGSDGRLIELLDDGKKVDWHFANIDIAPDNSSFAVIWNKQIRIIPLDGKGTTRVFDIGEVQNSWAYLAWSPDARNLAFIQEKETDDPASNPDGGYQIFKISRDGGKPVRVASDDDYPKSELSWSPDGKWLAYGSDRTVKVRPESTIWAVDFDEILKKR